MSPARGRATNAESTVEATTVGRRLTSLERSLGAPLVVRGPDGLSLTPLGKKLAPLVSEVERAVVAVTESVSDQKARVRVAMPSGIARFASASYLERKPEPIDPDDLTGHEIVAYDVKVASFLAAQWIEERARKATIVVRNRELTEMVDSILGGVGLGLIPCWFEAFEPSLKRLSPAVLVSRSFSVVYRREVLLVPHMRAVIDFVVSVVQENAVTIAGDAA